MIYDKSDSDSVWAPSLFQCALAFPSDEILQTAFLIAAVMNTNKYQSVFYFSYSMHAVHISLSTGNILEDGETKIMFFFCTILKNKRNNIENVDLFLVF